MKTHSVLPMLSIALILGAPVASAQEEETMLSEPIIAAADLQVAAQDTSRPPSEALVVDRDVVVIDKKAPVYPEVAKKAGMNGKVLAKIWVTAEGKVRDVQIVQSSADVFNKSVLDAAWSYRFTPALVNDKPTAVWITVPFAFVLADKPAGAEQHSYNELSEFVRDVLNGKHLDDARMRAAIHPEAYAALGGEYIQLMEAIRRQAGAGHIIEPPNRTIAFTSYILDGKGDAAYMTVRTEAKGKPSKPRYHTVLFYADEKGAWTIRGWQSSQ
jgi:TonB family protein